MTILHSQDGVPIQATNRLPVENTKDLRGLAANRPAANTVEVGTTYWVVSAGGTVQVSDGTNWVEV